MTLMYNNFHTWQDTSDPLANQTTHVHFKFLDGKKNVFTDALHMLSASLKILQ